MFVSNISEILSLAFKRIRKLGDRARLYKMVAGCEFFSVNGMLIVFNKIDYTIGIQGLSWQTIFMVIMNTYPSHGHSSDNVCFLLMNY